MYASGSWAIMKTTVQHPTLDGAGDYRLAERVYIYGKVDLHVRKVHYGFVKSSYEILSYKPTVTIYKS